MVTRRQFLNVLAGAAAIVVPDLVVPRRSFFLPPPGGWPRGKMYIGTRFHDYDLPSTYLTSPTAWFLKTDDPAGLKHYTRGGDLSEASIDAMCAQIRELTRDGEVILRIKPTHFLRFTGSRGVEMPNRSIKDEMQGTLHRFAQSLGLSPADEGDKPAGTPTAPPPKVDPPSGVQNAADKLKGQQSVIDKQIADAGG